MKGCNSVLIGLIVAAVAAVGVVVLGLRGGDLANSVPETPARLSAAAIAPSSTPMQITSPTSTATLVALPTETPIPTSAPTLPPPTPPPPTPPISIVQPSILLGGIVHEWQTWNNCGPATLAMNLSYFGSSLKQADIGAVLRSSPDDKNVSPYELVEFALAQGYDAVQLVNGDDDLLRTLLSNGLPVLLETWYEREPGDGIGHYRLLVGYNDATQQWTLFDSLDATGLVSAEPYAGIRMSYAHLAELWKVFNHAFVLLYPPEQAALADAILATHGLTADRMWVDAEVRARTDVATNEGDLFAWFNLGSTLTRQSRTAEAAVAFDRARQIGLPKRMLWYQFAPFETYLAEGRPQDIMALTDVILEETESIEEVFYWRAQALLALGDVAGAQVAVQQSLALAPGFRPSVELNRLLENG